MSWWVADYIHAGEYVRLISQIFWVLFSITMHELAHGWAAFWQGDNTPQRYHRMTLNPIVHMGQWSLLMFAIIGIAWGVMPVTPSNFRWKRRGRIVVSGAGPAMNLALALVAMTLLVLWLRIGPPHEPIYQHLAVFFFTGCELNLVLAVFNLLPIPPLDGSDILAGLSMRWYMLYQRGNLQMIGMFMVLVLMMSGAMGFVWGAAYGTTVSIGDSLGSLVGNQPVEQVIYP